MWRLSFLSWFILGEARWERERVARSEGDGGDDDGNCEGLHEDPDEKRRQEYHASLVYPTTSAMKPSDIAEVGRKLASLSLAGPLPSVSSPVTTRPTFTDFMNLQSHVCSWPEAIRDEWCTNERFILSVFSQSSDLVPVGWTFDDILHAFSRIESNGFGLFTGDVGFVPQFVDIDDPSHTPSATPATHSLSKLIDAEEGKRDPVKEQQNKPSTSKILTRSPERSKPSSICFARASSHTFTSRRLHMLGDYKCVYPSASFFNHSCVPNAHAVPMNSLRLFPRQLNTAVDLAGGVGSADNLPPTLPLEELRPFREIGLGRVLTFEVAPVDAEMVVAGEEVTIAYIGLDQPRQAARMSLLAQEYFFDCVCTRCRAEDEATENPKGKQAKGKRTKGGKTRKR